MMHSADDLRHRTEATLTSDGAAEAQVFATLAVAAAIDRLAAATERMAETHHTATEVAAQALNA